MMFSAARFALKAAAAGVAAFVLVRQCRSRPGCRADCSCGA